jgi:hypothetical protein
MHDGFGTIRDGYFVPHSHELRWCGAGRWLLMPVGATHPEVALAVAPADDAE